MVRPASRRVGKYSVKIDATQVAARFQNLKPMMTEQVGNIFPDLAVIEEKTKAILDYHGVSVIKIPFYLSFVRECYKITETHPGDTAAAEISAIIPKWQGRGLDPKILKELAKDIFGIVIA